MNIASKLNMTRVVTTIDPQFTAQDLQLYKNEKSDECAAAINHVLKVSVNSGHDRRATLYALGQVLHTYRECGATDTEPYWVIREAIDAIFGE